MLERFDRYLVPFLVALQLVVFADAQQWTIGSPTIAYRALRVTLDYIISSTLKKDDVILAMFQDDAFRNSISNGNNFLTPNVVVDGSSGTQKVTVTFDVHEQNILGSPIIATAGSRSIVSFSARLSIRDPKIPSNTATSMDTSVTFELTTAGKVGITGLLEDQEDRYGVDVYECDKDNNRLPVVQPKSQEDSLRLCVEPDKIAKNDAVEMYSISSLNIEDGLIIQNVMVDGSVQNSATTEHGCTLDGRICYIETSVDNSFFTIDQIVHATGMAALQYKQDNGRRGLVEARIRRRTRSAGGPAGQKAFDLAFEVEPSSSTYDARAYLCDQRQNEMSESEIKPKRHGESVSVCVSPTQEAKNQGIFVRDIKSFVFSKRGEMQLLEKPSETTSNGKDASPGESSSVSSKCTPGEPVCSFSIILADVFFDGKDEPIIGEGEIELQFGSGTASWTRRMSVAVRWNDKDRIRFLEENDPDFAGVSSVSMIIPVDPTSIAPPVAWASRSLSFWASMPTYGKALIIIGVILGVAVILAGAWCFIYGIESFHFLPFFKSEDDFMYDDDDDYDYEGDYHDPEEGPMDTEEGLKGEGRGGSLESIDKRSRMKSQSPSRFMNDSETTKSISSHSRVESSPRDGRGRSKDPSKGRARSLSPSRDIKPKGKPLQSQSFHGRIESKCQSERRERTRSSSKERFRSVSPSRRSTGGSTKPASTQSFLGFGNNFAKQTRSKGPVKPASIDNLLGWFGKTDSKQNSSVNSQPRPRSLSPGRVIRTSKSTKSASMHGRVLPKDTKPPKASRKMIANGKATNTNGKALKLESTQGKSIKKSASTHRSRTVSPKRTTSRHSRDNSTSSGRKSVASSTQAQTKTGKIKKKSKSASSNHSTSGSSCHSRNSSSGSISDVSVDSGEGTRMKGRKKDVLANSAHSVQSFASSAGSFCSTDSSDLDLGADVTGVKRGKRPGGNGKKKTKGTKLKNSYDIVNRLD